MPIYDVNNNVVSPAVGSAVSRPNVIEILNRTLNGKYHLQMIGEGATMLDVVAHFTMAEKLVFDTIKKTGSTIRVTFDGRYYVGVVGEEPSYERIANTWDPMFTITFTLYVEEEGVV